MICSGFSRLDFSAMLESRPASRPINKTTEFFGSVRIRADQAQHMG